MPPDTRPPLWSFSDLVRTYPFWGLAFAWMLMHSGQTYFSSAIVALGGFPNTSFSSTQLFVKATRGFSLILGIAMGLMLAWYYARRSPVSLLVRLAVANLILSVVTLRIPELVFMWIPHGATLVLMNAGYSAAAVLLLAIVADVCNGRRAIAAAAAALLPLFFVSDVVSRMLLALLLQHDNPEGALFAAATCHAVAALLLMKINPQLFDAGPKRRSE